LTTIELLIALAIIGILIGIGYVVLPRDRFAVNQAAEGLRADVELARFQAVGRGGYVRLAIDPGANRYRLVEVEWNGSTWVEVAELKVVPLSTNRTPTVRIGGGSTLNDLFYDPRGNAIGQGAQTLLLESASSDYVRTVSISQQGRVDIQ
jgi:prepilin-type N-terminal cleavage/methylation domain-containing protein